MKRLDRRESIYTEGPDIVDTKRRPDRSEPLESPAFNAKLVNPATRRSCA